ncbi:MAG: DNA helicase [Spirochaetes bacterium]|nr:MAG: DNA helicase [Spirochaetota bacterium]
MFTEDYLKPIIVQSDNSILLDVHSRYFEEARADIGSFTELEKSPEHMHTYRITPLSLWNAASAGISGGRIVEILECWSRFPLPENVIHSILDTISRFGKIRLLPTEDENLFFLLVEDNYIESELISNKALKEKLIPAEHGFYIRIYHRGTVKQQLIKLGFPVKDEAPLSNGERFPFSLRERTKGGYPFKIRSYQAEAAESFLGNNQPGTGFGTVVLPCGAGKTIVGMAVMDRLKTSTLILSTNIAAVHQWMDELLDKSNITREDIGEYTGDLKEIRPITVSTYQILTWRSSKEEDFPHFALFRRKNWGLIIYDEVHLLPAPVFRVTAEIQAIRRLGLTATLVREDNREDDVFSLVGPKRYDVPWKEMEIKGWIAEANCYEIRVGLPSNMKIHYAVADNREKFRIASENPLKIEITRQIIKNHREDSIIIIGQYLSQLKTIASEFRIPLITGNTPNPERELIYNEFRKGGVKVIVVSKVANFAIDLPDASVAIQVSGTFGSRQEEAQRLGRILRPKRKNSYFFSIVSRYTVEEGFAANRQKFLTEQGYKYHIEIWDK